MSAEATNIGHRALAGAAWMVGFRLASRLLGVASTLVLARLLVSADFGLAAIAFTISAALNSISNVGVTENLVRHREIGRDLLDTGFTINVIKGLITGLLLLLAAPLASAWFHEPRLQPVMYVLSAVYALSGFENVGVIHFRRDLRFDREFQLSALERVIVFLATLISALILRNYWALIIGIGTSKVVRLVATYAMHPYRPRLGLKSWHELAGLSFWMWISSLAYIVWQRADPLVVGSAVGAAELGLFVVALDIALLPASEILEPVASVLFAGFAAERNAGRDPQANALRLAVTVLAAMAPIALLLSAGSVYGVAVLLGPKWTAAGPLISILALAVLLMPFSYTASVVLTATGKLKANFAVVTSASVAKLLLLYAASQTGSLTVVALASLSITTIECSLFVVMLRRYGSSASGIAWPLLRVAAAAMLTAAAMYGSGLGWAGTPAPLLTSIARGAAVAVLGFGTYVGALGLLWAASGRPEGPERQIIAAGLPVIARVRSRAALLLGRKPLDAA